VTGDHTELVELTPDPEVQTSALAWPEAAKASARKRNEAQTLADSSSAEGLSLARVATPTGLEPAASAVTGRSVT
jgi:hypothetical protein